MGLFVLWVLGELFFFGFYVFELLVYDLVGWVVSVVDGDSDALQRGYVLE